MSPRKLKKFVFASKGILSRIIEEEKMESKPLLMLKNGEIPLVGHEKVLSFIAGCVLDIEFYLLSKYEEDLLNPQFRKQLKRLHRISESLKMGTIPKYD